MISPPYAFKNYLLAALNADDLKAILPHLQPVELKQRLILYDIGSPYDYVYFIEQGVASVLTTMENGTGIEVGMVGREGLVALSALMGDEASTQQVVMQLPGNGYRINAARCKDIFENSDDLRKSILRYANSFLQLSAQTAACNRLHTVEQRLARWLLLSSDRFKSDVLPLTHEYLANMLGVRRPGVTETAGVLQRAGLIDYSHGEIRIVDRDGLERTACECYAVDHERFLRLIE